MPKASFTKKGSPSLDLSFFWCVCVSLFFRGGGMGWAKGMLREGGKTEGKAKTIEEKFYFFLVGSFY